MEGTDLDETSLSEPESVRGLSVVRRPSPNRRGNHLRADTRVGLPQPRPAHRGGPNGCHQSGEAASARRTLVDPGVVRAFASAAPHGSIRKISERGASSVAAWWPLWWPRRSPSNFDAAESSSDSLTAWCALACRCDARARGARVAGHRLWHPQAGSDPLFSGCP